MGPERRCSGGTGGASALPLVGEQLADARVGVRLHVGEDGYQLPQRLLDTFASAHREG